MAVQLELTSSSCVLDETWAEPSPFSDSSTIHSCSPGRKLCDDTLFESIDEYVPLPNFGLSPKNTLTVLLHAERIVTETGPCGAGAADALDDDDDDGGGPDGSLDVGEPPPPPDDGDPA
jgi:hypothetical protein